VSVQVRLLDRSNLTIVTNAASLLGTAVITSGLGYLFWLLAARRFPVEAIGLAGGLVSAMMLLANVGVLGLGTLLVSEIPRQREHPGPLISAATLVAAFASAVLGLIFAFVAGSLFGEFAVLVSDLAASLLFAAGVAVMAATMILDQACVALLRSDLQLARNTSFGLLKLGLLAALAWLAMAMTAMGIYGTWAFGGIVSILVPATIVLVGARGDLTGVSIAPRLRMLHGLRRAAGGHHALNLALLAPGLCLPIIVTALLSPTTNAYFYSAAMMAALVWAGPAALASMVHAVGVRSPSELGHRTVFSLRLSAVGGALATVVVLVAAELLLALFGEAYASEAGTTLRLLTVSVFPIIVKYHYVAIARVTGRVARAAAILSVGAVAEVAGGAVGGAFGGLTGLSIGWLAVMVVEAVVVAPVVLRTIRESRNVP
jgi:O-antigen/teichoic acid export membrane protein